MLSLSHAVRRSKAYFWSAKLSQKQKQLCMYYCRFGKQCMGFGSVMWITPVSLSLSPQGKCSRDNCPYIHDPEKITVCHK